MSQIPSGSGTPSPSSHQIRPHRFGGEGVLIGGQNSNKGHFLTFGVDFIAFGSWDWVHRRCSSIAAISVLKA